MRLPIALALALGAIICGTAFQYKPYHTYEVGYGDQHPLDHRESAYSSITWMVSQDDNFQQLKFFDKVEGGICLRPAWDDLIALAQKEPTLRHLVPDPAHRPKPMAGGPDWPHTWLPDPGTVTNSAYIRLFPVGVLLNDEVMKRAGGDLQKADPKILVVGLGSGIGIANLAHHFPQASITVVDIDRVVEDMVRDHYPLLAWLLTQKLANGEPRLRFEVGDARRFILYDAKREQRPYDLVILDAYTSGSTIPPHLMTREFFAECADIITPDGIVFANVIGSLTGEKRRVSGGAMRSFRAAGLTHLWNFPILVGEEGPGTLKTDQSRNNIVVCSRKPLDPRGNTAGWERLKAFEPYPQLPRGISTSASYMLANDMIYFSSALPAALIDHALPTLKSRMQAVPLKANQLQYPQRWLTKDPALIDQVFQAVRDAVAKGTLREFPRGWLARGNDIAFMERRETDWVLAARDLYRNVIQVARDPNYSGEALVGPLEAERPTSGTPTWTIVDAPLFTDQMPNADIFNN
jgi:SAM-dependent methyltransferase